MIGEGFVAKFLKWRLLKPVLDEALFELSVEGDRNEFLDD